MNVISFSLYGDNPIYTIGAIKNAHLAKHHFPEWTVRIYHDNTVPSNILNELRELDNVQLCEMFDTNKGFLRSIWRFIPLFDSEITRFISRDCDSRLSERDRIAVDEWIASGKQFHIVRDHPHGHGWVINAGMWGARCISRDPLVDDPYEPLYEIITSFCNSPQNLQEKTLDQILLRDHIYPRIVNDAFIHDEYFKYENHCEKIKMDRASNDFAFIGESIDENDVPRGDQRSSIRERYYA